MNAKKVKSKMLNDEIIKMYECMSEIEDPNCQKYVYYEDRLKNLVEIEKISNEANSDFSKIFETIIKVGIPGTFGLLQILLILNYEKLNVLSTKAVGFVLRGRT